MHTTGNGKSGFVMLQRWVLIACLSCLPVSALAEEEGEGVFAPKVEYIEIQPEIVTNYGGAGGRLHFLRARATARATGSDAADAVRYHMAYIQNTLLMLLGAQTKEEAVSMESREQLRQTALAQINEFLVAEGEPKIDDLLFTEFLVQ